MYLIVAIETVFLPDVNSILFLCRFLAQKNNNLHRESRQARSLARRVLEKQKNHLREGKTIFYLASLKKEPWVGEVPRIILCELGELGGLGELGK